MKIEKLVDDLVDVKDELESYKEHHKAVFETVEALEKRIEELTEKIKVESREQGIDTETDRVRVSISKVFKSWYDPFALSVSTIKLLIKEDGIETVVDKKVFEDLVKKGEISEEEKALAYQEEQQTTKVLIKFKD